MADYLGEFTTRVRGFLSFAESAESTKSNILSNYSKLCSASNRLEKSIDDCESKLEKVLDELQYSIEKASADGLSESEEEYWNNEIYNLQRSRTELTENLQSMKKDKETVEEKKQKTRSSAQNLKMQCQQRMNMIEQFISDCKVQISKIEKSNSATGQVSSFRFGGTGRQVDSDTAKRIQTYYQLISGGVAAKSRIANVLQSSSSGNDNEERERDRGSERER